MNMKWGSTLAVGKRRNTKECDWENMVKRRSGGEAGK